MLVMMKATASIYHLDEATTAHVVPIVTRKATPMLWMAAFKVHNPLLLIPLLVLFNSYILELNGLNADEY